MKKSIDFLPEWHLKGYIPPARFLIYKFCICFVKSDDFVCRSDGFYDRRKKQIVSRLRSIERMSAQELWIECTSSFESHRHSPCVFVPWEHLDSDEVGSCHYFCYYTLSPVQVASFAIAANGERLAIIFHQILKFPESYCRGAPDLVFWKLPQKNHDGTIRNHDIAERRERDEPFMNYSIFAVEVKSANDVLSVWQVLWLELLQTANIPVEILKVLGN